MFDNKKNFLIFEDHCLLLDGIHIFGNFNFKEIEKEYVRDLEIFINGQLLENNYFVINIENTIKYKSRWSPKDGTFQFCIIIYKNINLFESSFTFKLYNNILFDNIKLQTVHLNISKNFSGVLTMMKNEENRVQEWINYNLNLGFSNIIICLNNSEDKTLEKIRELNNPAVHTVIFNYKPHGNGKSNFKEIQLSCLSIFMNLLRNTLTWISWQDCDEFIIIKNNKDINSILKDKEYEKALSVQGLVFTNKDTNLKIDNNVFNNCIYTDNVPQYKKFIVNLSKFNYLFFYSVHNVNGEHSLNMNNIYYKHCWINQRCLYHSEMFLISN